MRIERAAVIGAGTMGSGIAQVLAQAGLDVRLLDIVPTQLTRGQESIRRNTQRLVDKGQMAESEQCALLQRITVSTALEETAQAQFVIEAIVEQAEAKRQLLTTVDQWAPHDAILASNTSSLSITQLATSTRRPDRFIGMHFVNPVPLMRLVEVIRGLATSDETHAAILALAQQIGKSPVTVQDMPGFALNRMLIPMLNEAVYLLMEGTASRDDIDTVMKLGASHPIGPLALADMIGLDICLAIMQVLHDDLGDDKFRPCPLLRNMVAAGLLGRKAGRGFYDYPPPATHLQGAGGVSH